MGGLRPAPLAPVVARSRYRLGPAAPGDDAALRALLREIPVPGAVTTTSEREPSFFATDAVLGDTHTIVARTRVGGPPVGFGSRSTREVWIGGAPVRMAYLSGLRVAPAHQGRALLGQGWTALRALHHADPVELSLVSVSAENARVARLLSLGRGDAARLAPVADVVTLALFTHRGHRPPPSAPLDAVNGLRGALGPARDLFPASALSLPGLSPDDDVLVESGGRAVAAGSVWDSRPVRQTVVQAYQGLLGRLRPAIDVVGRIAGESPLPRVGAAVASGTLVRPVASDPGAFDALVGAALGRARQRGLALLLVGLDAQDPALARVRRRPHIPYRTTLYAASWPGDDPPRLATPVHVEIATL